MVSRTRVWQRWSERASKETWRAKLAAAGLSEEGKFIGEGPWTSDQVHDLWALLFRRGRGRVQVISLKCLIEDGLLCLADPEELVSLLDDLNNTSLKNSDLGNDLESNSTIARSAIKAICRALIGPGGRPRTTDRWAKERQAWEARQKERDALWVLDADREAKRRTRKGDEVTLRDVMKERLDSGNHPFWNSGVSFEDLVNGRFKTRTFANSAVKAGELDRNYRILIRKNNTKWKIHDALGLKKRRNKKRTRNPPPG